MNISIETPFCLFAHCVIVKGSKRSTISDLEKGSFNLIPNSLYDFIKEYEGMNIKTILSQFDVSEHDTIYEYFSFLEKNGYIFFTNTPNNFTPLNTNWSSPSIITNAIIDIGSRPLDIALYQKALIELSSLLCKAVQIRCFTSISHQFLLELLNLDWGKITDIQLLLKCSLPTLNEQSEIYDQNIRTSYICFHSSPFEKVNQLSKENLQNVYFIKSEITDSSHCGNILKSYFSVNMETYTESLSFNSCLNRKIGIDINGDIKNCPSLSQSFGNISSTSINKVVGKKGFQEVWLIKKEDISDCNICEFRHICTDCRLGEEGKLEKFKKPKNCTYDPRTATWK